jgi:branched-subunit amino acid aminotransferase/4-amino-4-deoxychorismate lyase
MGEIIYLNGRLIARSKAKLSPFDHGFLYEYGLFETMRAYNGYIFRLDRHLARLRRSAQSLGLANRLATFDLEAACTKTLDATGKPGELTRKLIAAYRKFVAEAVK